MELEEGSGIFRVTEDVGVAETEDDGWFIVLAVEEDVGRSETLGVSDNVARSDALSVTEDEGWSACTLGVVEDVVWSNILCVAVIVGDT